jgi:hypothetical protein
MRVELDKALRCVARRLRRPITPLMPSSGRLPPPPACCLSSMPIPFADGLWWFRERRSSDALYTALAKEVKDEQATLKQRFNELQQRVVEVRHTADYGSTSRQAAQGRSFTRTPHEFIRRRLSGRTRIPRLSRRARSWPGSGWSWPARTRSGRACGSSSKTISRRGLPMSRTHPHLHNAYLYQGLMRWRSHPVLKRSCHQVRERELSSIREIHRRSELDSENRARWDDLCMARY